MKPSKNTQKLEDLVRSGLMPTKDLWFLRSALQSAAAGIVPTRQERLLLDKLIQRLLTVTYDDPAIRTKMKINAMNSRTTNEELLNLSKMPDSMLDVIANSKKAKEKAGGKATEADKKLSLKARVEKRRREKKKEKEKE